MAPAAIVYHAQGTATRCGPAAVRMLLATLLDDHRSEDELAAAMGSDSKGTRKAAMHRYLRDAGLACAERTAGTMEELDAFVADGWLVLVLYTLPHRNEDHYSVVYRTQPDVLLADPRYGPDHAMTRDEFLDRWTCLEGPDPAVPRWMLAVRRDD